MDKAQKALELIEEWGSIDGSHHKQWVFDQLVRILSDDYERWVEEWNEGGIYAWDEGRAP